MTSVDLARLQFSVTTLIHFAIVGASIGLVFFVAIMQTRWARSGDERWLRLTRYYGRPLLIVFGVGVVTGIFQTFQFGMNWSQYSRFVGEIFGPPLALEGLGAFFVEAIFLGLWIFGWGRLPKRLHLACIWIVAFATTLSAYSILTANSWMQHPVGYKIVDGHAELTDIWPVLFNANVGLTWGHVISGALLTGAVIVLAIAAWNLARGRAHELFRPVASMAVKIGLVAALATATFGHFQGMLASEQQPMKMAAAEANYETERPAGLSLFALGGLATNPGGLIVDIKLPGVLSVLTNFSLSSSVPGINPLQREAEARYGPGNYVPIVGLVYWSFRMMVGSGMALLALMAAGCWLAVRDRLHLTRWFLRLAPLAAALPFLAQAGGWILRENGRQPWVVEGLLRTDAANSPNVSAWAVGGTLILFAVVYLTIVALAGRALAGELAEVPGEATADSRAVRTGPASADLAFTY